MAGNSNLHDSARNKQDEFYTQLSLIEKEAMKIALKKVRGGTQALPEFLCWQNSFVQLR